MKLVKPEEPQDPKGTPSTAEVIIQVDGKSLPEYGTSVEGNKSTCFVSVAAGDMILVASTNTSGKLDIVDLIIDGILRDSKHNTRSKKEFAVEFNRVCHQPKRPGKQSKQALQLFEMQVQPRNTETDERSSDTPNPSSVGDITVRIYRSDLDDPSESAESGPRLNRGHKYSDYSTWSDLNFHLSPDEPPPPFEIGYVNGDKKSCEIARKRIKAEFTEDYTLWAAFTFKLRSPEELRSRGFNVPDRPARPSNSQHEPQQAADISKAGMTGEISKPSEFPKVGGRVLQSSMNSILAHSESPRIERVGPSDAQHSIPRVDDTRNTPIGHLGMQVVNPPARRTPSSFNGSGGLNQRKAAWAQNGVTANASNTPPSNSDNRSSRPRPLDEPIKLKATPRKVYVEDAVDEDDKHYSHHSMPPPPSTVCQPISNPPRSNTARRILSINDFQPVKIRQLVPQPVSRSSLGSLEELLDQENGYNPAAESTEHGSVEHGPRVHTHPSRGSEIQLLRERGRDGRPPVRITNPELNADDHPKVGSIEKDEKPNLASSFVTRSSPAYESWQGRGTSQDSDYDRMERRMPHVISDTIQSPRFSSQASGLSVLAERMKVNSQSQAQTPIFRPSSFPNSGFAFTKYPEEYLTISHEATPTSALIPSTTDTFGKGVSPLQKTAAETPQSLTNNLGQGSAMSLNNSNSNARPSTTSPRPECELREDTMSLPTQPPSTTKLSKRKAVDISRDSNVAPPVTEFPSWKESAAPALRNTYQREMGGPRRSSSSSSGLNISNANEHAEAQPPEPNTYEDYIQKKSARTTALEPHFAPHFAPLHHKKKEAQDRYQAAFDTRRKEQLKYEQALANNKDRAEIRELHSNAQKLEREIADLRVRTAALSNDCDTRA